MTASNDDAKPIYVSAIDHGMLVCEGCRLLQKAIDGESVCARCGEVLHARKPFSLTRSTALIVTAMIAYIPANVLPIMHTSTVLSNEEDTIINGVVLLAKSGSWPLAALVFFASIIVPSLKLVSLSILIIAARRRSVWRQLERARLYRIIEFVGRWSMLDIYVVTLLVALVHIRGLATIQAGPASIAFGSVVVLTMLASISFDPRLIWDRASFDAHLRPEDATPEPD